MIGYIKKKFVLFLALFVIFFDEIFQVSFIAMGLTSAEGVKQYQAILLFAIVFPIMFFQIIRGKLEPKARQVLVFCSLILILYLITPLFYRGIPSFYTTYLLAYGAECIPAAYVGILLAKATDMDKMIRYLPFLLIPTILVIGTIGFTVAMKGAMILVGSEDGGALTYHSLSYLMAYSFSYCCYYLFWGKRKNTKWNKILVIFLSLLMLYSAIVCAISGGRGGFMVLAIQSFLIFSYYISRSNTNIFRSIFFVIILLGLSFYILSEFGLSDSSGLSRISAHLTEDSGRGGLYNQAIDVFLSSPIIGHGLGSIWWTIGLYSHNLVMDLLAEVGLVGAIVLMLILIRSFVSLFKLSKIDPVNFFIILVYTGALINNSFSEYWIASYKLFFVCAFAFCRRSLQKPVLSLEKLEANQV